MTNNNFDNIQTGLGGCSKHGAVEVCGHTDATCLDNFSEENTERSFFSESAIDLVIDRLEKSIFDSEFSGQEAEKKREQLIEIARQLPNIAIGLLKKFRQVAANENLDTGKLVFFLVGGRVRGTAIRDNTDFDVVITSEKKLNPRNDNITWDQRHIIGRQLYEEEEKLFSELGLSEYYERGIVEIKGLGERNEEELKNEEDTLKIVELV